MLEVYLSIDLRYETLLVYCYLLQVFSSTYNASKWVDTPLVFPHFPVEHCFGLRDVLLGLSWQQHKQLRVAIYGAGDAGAQLAASLRLTRTHKIITFLDDNPDYWERTINDIPIRPPQMLRQLVNSVDQVLLAIPSLSRSERRRILDDLQGSGLTVLQVPSVDDLTSGRARIDALRPILIEDLLGRDVVPSDPQLLGPGISGQVVCVTGAGGSIGSELCRQILALSPSKLILLERSEPSLYSIQQELFHLFKMVVSFTLYSVVRTIPSCFINYLMTITFIPFFMLLLINMFLLLK